MGSNPSTKNLGDLITLNLIWDFSVIKNEIHHIFIVWVQIPNAIEPSKEPKETKKRILQIRCMLSCLEVAPMRRYNYTNSTIGP